MKIAIVGCGAVGGFYGARLSRASADVHLLLRSDFATVRAAGVRILSVDGDFTAHPRAARRPEEIGVCDVVLIALKTTANDQFARLLPPLVGAHTFVVTLQNGLGNEDRLAALFGPERVGGGLCFVCLNRVAPGVIRHTAHGLVVLGEHRRPAGGRVRRLAALFDRAGIPVRATDDLERAHWEKLVWNVPFNGLGVAGVVGYEAFLAGRVPDGGWDRRQTLATDALLANPRWLGLARELMGEVIRGARGRGFALAESLAEDNLQRTRCMGAYKASTLLDFERGLPLEVESLFEEPRRQAEAAGVSMPRLATLCAVLRKLDARPSAPPAVSAADQGASPRGGGPGGGVDCPPPGLSGGGPGGGPPPS
jgi:2-dehydropantoate 2-reductase